VRRAPFIAIAGLLVAGDPLAAKVGTGATGVVSVERDLMQRVPAGPFIMGMDDDERIEAQEACRREMGEDLAPFFCEQTYGLSTAATGTPREVWLSGFEMDTYEVTTQKYRSCVVAGACDVAPLVKGDTRLIKDEWPVVNVTWYDADSYCRWRGKRLPTEAEWEKAARGVDGRRFPWGQVDGDDRANRGMAQEETFRPPPQALIYLGTPDASDGYKLLAPPGSFRFGKSPYGVHDLAGNVEEWVADWWVADAYRSAATIDPHGPATGGARATRGGSFNDPRLYSRTYYRGSEAPTSRALDRGFRCARSLAP
jgi:formylglycine-generating enzyme required for sulfatase activity